MIKKIRMDALIFVCIGILIVGFIKVNASFPRSSKDRAELKVSYSLKPFDFIIDTENFRVQINGNLFSNIEKESKGFFQRVEEKFKKKEEL